MFIPSLPKIIAKDNVEGMIICPLVAKTSRNPNNKGRNAKQFKKMKK